MSTWTKDTSKARPSKSLRVLLRGAAVRNITLSAIANYVLNVEVAFHLQVTAYAIVVASTQVAVLNGLLMAAAVWNCPLSTVSCWMSLGSTILNRMSSTSAVNGTLDVIIRLICIVGDCFRSRFRKLEFCRLKKQHIHIRHMDLRPQYWILRNNRPPTMYLFSSMGQYSMELCSRKVQDELHSDRLKAAMGKTIFTTCNL